jgi:hypothetical protein
VIATDPFEDSWCSARTTRCGQFGKICGGWDKTGSGTTIEKTYTVPSSGSYRVTMDLFMVDSWDTNEKAKLSVNGVECWSATTASGGQIGGFNQICGEMVHGWKERHYAPSCDVTVSGTSLTIKASGTIGQGAKDESLAIDNVRIVAMGGAASASNTCRNCPAGKFRSAGTRCLKFTSRDWHTYAEGQALGMAKSEMSWVRKGEGGWGTSWHSGGGHFPDCSTGTFWGHGGSGACYYAQCPPGSSPNHDDGLPNYDNEGAGYPGDNCPCKVSTASGATCQECPAGRFSVAGGNCEPVAWNKYLYNADDFWNVNGLTANRGTTSSCISGSCGDSHLWKTISAGPLMTSGKFTCEFKYVNGNSDQSPGHSAAFGVVFDASFTQTTGSHQSVGYPAGKGAEFLGNKWGVGMCGGKGVHPGDYISVHVDMDAKKVSFSKWEDMGDQTSGSKHVDCGEHATSLPASGVRCAASISGGYSGTGEIKLLAITGDEYSSGYWSYKGCYEGTNGPPGWPAYSSTAGSAVWYAGGARLSGSYDSIVEQCKATCAGAGYANMAVHDNTACFCSNVAVSGDVRPAESTSCYVNRVYESYGSIVHTGHETVAAPTPAPGCPAATSSFWSGDAVGPCKQWPGGCCGTWGNCDTYIGCWPSQSKCQQERNALMALCPRPY